ncbi:MAG: hypothetical protein IPI67_05135 [Myxococcales bacterium]|nr:hypothetical protein [Myxococcales bacterium]
MVEPKQISKVSVPHALEKAERYRLLNEPFFAESICLDVLAADPTNKAAPVVYVLALTDQVARGQDGVTKRAREAIEKLATEYERVYYSGILCERRAVGALTRAGYDAKRSAWHHIEDAMKLYEQADALQTDDTNDDAILRYNSCLRLIAGHNLSEPPSDRCEYPLE